MTNLREYIEDSFRENNITMTQIDKQYGEQIPHQWIVDVTNECHDAEYLERNLKKICEILFQEGVHYGRVMILLYFCRRLDLHLKEREWYTDECIDILTNILIGLNFQKISKSRFCVLI